MKKIVQVSLIALLLLISILFSYFYYSKEKPPSLTKDRKLISGASYTKKCSVSLTFNDGSTKLIETSVSKLSQEECGYIFPLDISDSKRFVAYEDLENETGPMTRLYFSETDQDLRLEAYGATAIFDLEFIPQDFLAILFGYPAVKEEQYLTVYYIPGLIKTIPSNYSKDYIEEFKGNSLRVGLPILKTEVRGLEYADGKLLVTDKEGNTLTFYTVEEFRTSMGL